ncbi:MAG TPA: hypothetical protein VNN55_03330 [bacterium]|nr:hypothetical protein [bacterium]
MRSRLLYAVAVLTLWAVTPVRAADTLSTPTVFYQDVAWAPDGNAVAFTAMINQKPSEVYTMVLRGKLVTRLTKNDAVDAGVCWSKDGAKLFFTSNRDGNDEIYVMNADGGGMRRLTNHPGRDAAPCLSPDGNDIVFVSDRDGNPDLYIMSLNGATVERLTNTPGAEHNPRWSPDGRKVACYLSAEGAKDQVVVIDANTGDSRILGDAASGNSNPNWSIDGASVIYCSAPAEGERWIFAAAADGSKNDKLLPLPAFYAAYSPDGKRIAYIGGSWPSSNLYVIDYSDGTMRCLTCDITLDPELVAETKPAKSKKK